MDKVVDHLLIFKGEGEIHDFPGNYTQYREWCRLQPKTEGEGAEKKATKPTAKEQHSATQKKEGKRKMTYKEKREYEQLTKELEQLENEQKTMGASSPPRSPPPRAARCTPSRWAATPAEFREILIIGRGVDGRLEGDACTQHRP